MEAFVLQGLVIGSIYAISSLGLVLTYTSSRVFNFAHGAMAYTIAIFYYWLNTKNGWPTWSAALVSILVVSPLLGLVLWRLLFRLLTHAPPAVRFVSTVGLWVALPALTKIVFPFSRGEIFETRGLVEKVDTSFISPFGVNVNTDQFVVLVAGLLVVVGLTVLMRMTPLGLMTRATVDSPRTAGVAGINTTAVTAGAWMLGATLAGLAGVLLSPSNILGIQETQFTLLLVASFAAAVVGRLTSLPLTFAGSMLIGLLYGTSDKWLPKETSLLGLNAEGIKPSIPFIVMLVALLLYQGLRREAFEADLRAGPVEEEAPAPPPTQGWRLLVGPAVTLLVLLSVPAWLDDSWFGGIGVVAEGLALAVIFLSFTVATGEAGMVSLCQISLAGIGGFATARLATEEGWPLLLALLAGGVIAMLLGLIVAGFSLRLGDLYLALATLAFALLIRNLVFEGAEFTNFGTGVNVDRPDWFGIDFSDLPGVGRDNFYIFMVVVFCLVALLVVNLRRSTTGLVFAAMRSTETASATIGVSIVRTKLIAFALASFIAGVGGGLYAIKVGFAAPLSFEVLKGAVWLAIVVTWGIRSVVGAAVAGMVFVITQQQLSFIFVIIVVFVMMGLMARLIGSRAIYKPAGVVTALVVLVGGLAGVVALLETDIELGESLGELPTVLFGVGAIFLAKRPQGVLADVLNRIRLRNARREARRAEAARLAEAPA